jgi:uncharacterized membrane protein
VKPPLESTPDDICARQSREFPKGFESSVVHLYRGEMNRMTVWRERLDITSNWAILLTVGLTTFTLGSVDVPHYTLLLGLALIAISILIEGRRYRHLHHSKWRIYLMEYGYFAEILDPSADNAMADWRRILARDLRHAAWGISWATAVRVRLRRNYLLLFYFVTSVWIAKLFIHPDSPASLAEFMGRMRVGQSFLPPWFVASTATFFVIGATLLAITCPPAEQLEDWTSRYLKESTELESLG